MREILFRGKSLDFGDWLCGYIRQYETGKITICDFETKRLWFVDPSTVGQFTGLYDCTKWEDLTDSEKRDFYKQHYIGEDGMSVRFQHIDDVRFLWKGKKIFEGDILRSDYYACKCVGYVKFGKHNYNDMDVADYNVGFFIDWNDGMLRNDLVSWIDKDSLKVIGNIHDNPELSEV